MNTFAKANPPPIPRGRGGFSLVATLTAMVLLMAVVVELMSLSLGEVRSGRRGGNCYDNAICESFFASLKAEAFPDGGRFESPQHARLAILINRECI